MLALPLDGSSAAEQGQGPTRDRPAPTPLVPTRSIPGWGRTSEDEVQNLIIDACMCVCMYIQLMICNTSVYEYGVFICDVNSTYALLEANCCLLFAMCTMCVAVWRALLK